MPKIVTPTAVVARQAARVNEPERQALVAAIRIEKRVGRAYAGGILRLIALEGRSTNIDGLRHGLPRPTRTTSAACLAITSGS
jgi:hypothetical protein